jgi:CRP-like cAMP-binding protein
MDDRFYVIVSGSVAVMRNNRAVGQLDAGDCFGETSYVRGAKRLATIKALAPVTLMKVSSTLLEQSSAACQLRFNKVFLRSLISRLQSPS